MKSTIAVLFLFFISSVAFGQSLAGQGGGLQAPYTNTYIVQDHPAHASQHAMATEESLLNSSGQTSAHGVRPLWEFGTGTVEVPLGTIARGFRENHGHSGSDRNRPHAVVYWEN